MERCPECRRDYYDDTLMYRLDDGNALLEGPANVGRTEYRTRLLPEDWRPKAGVGRASSRHFYGEPATAILNSTNLRTEALPLAQNGTTDETAILPNVSHKSSTNTQERSMRA
ncbi:hypothetical protein BH10ACI3_BH10ACI3_29130 [soil metagenome]